MRATRRMSRWSRGGRRLLGWVLCALVLGALGHSQTRSEEAHAILARARAGGLGSPAHREALATELLALGPDAIPVLFDAAAFGLERNDGPDASLGAPCREAIEQALAGMPTNSLRQYIQRRLTKSESDADRLVALRVLGRTGTCSDLQLLASVARGCPTDKVPSRPIRDAFRSALTRLATREENLSGAIIDALAQAHPALLEPLVSTLGARRGRAVRNDLRNALGRRREADAMLFSLLAKRVRALGRPNDPRLETLTLDGLRAHDSRTRTQAANLAAALDLVDAIPHLVEMVSRDDPLEGQAARQALRDLTHANPLADNQQWQAWFEEDLQWWQAEGQDLEDDLYAARPADVVIALRTLIPYRWRREQVIGGVARLALWGEPSLRRLAVTVLGSLGGPQAQDTLLDVIEDPLADGQLLADALSSLCACTELNLGEDPAIWRQVLAIRRR